MENHTPFDLTAAIRQWRQNLAQAPAFQQTDLDELESHLHDSIESLQAAGLSDEEAFLVAARRIGPAVSLATEFQKVGRMDGLLDRVVWVLMGIQIWFLFSTRIIPWVPGVYMVAATAVVWMTSKTFRRAAARALAWCIARPVSACATLILLSLFQKALWVCFLAVYAPQDSVVQTWVPLVCRDSNYPFLCAVYEQGVFDVTPELAVCAVLIAVLAMSRRIGRTEVRIAG